MSYMNGLCPKFASTISPGVWRPIVGYNLDYRQLHIKPRYNYTIIRL